MKKFFILLYFVLLPISVLMTITSCSKDNDGEIIVTVDSDGKADGGHSFIRIDDTNFYIDGIKYTAENGGLVVTSDDEKDYKGEATIISKLKYKGKTYEVLEIGRYAFCGCCGLTSITIGRGVTRIGENAFCHCDSLTSITIPESLTSIGRAAFSFCDSLSSVTIPNSVITIGSHAFKSCTSLTSITIPESVTNIDGWVFHDCTSLTTVIMKRSTPISIYESTFTNRRNATLYVPVGSKAAYQAAAYWKEFKEIVEKDM